MEWEMPITDRTAADAATAVVLSRKITDFGWDSLSPEEQAIWLSDMKGAYNQSDLNRVGNNMQYLADLLNSYGYKVKIQPKTDWLAADIPTQPQMAQLLADLQALQDAYYALASTPKQPTTMDNLKWYDANNIEQILLDIRTVITRMEKGYRYCGTFYCGQEVVLP